ncbi:MAG TPA: hypothetical protein VFE79_08240 [Paraburkholderia sp.]|jgi:lipopolysaccharide biosynthesis glycosyltransferase|nr:hypothetical protein [Paraburkholderia sp.]
MRILLTTAANDAYAPLLRGLLMSIRQFGDTLAFADIGCLDVGLSDENRAWAAGQVTHLVEAQWDLPVNAQTRAEAPHLRAMCARPFLPRYFPGYDLYIWIDCDAWVQERFVFDWLIDSARGGALGAVPELDRAYNHAFVAPWRVDRLRRYYGDSAANPLLSQSYYNSGVLALRADAPHWSSWATHLSRGVTATLGSLVCDQTALNHAIWTDSLPVYPLPSVCNWLCHLALPGANVAAQKFCEPLLPRAAIGILHLAGRTKDLAFPLTDETGSQCAPTSLRFQLGE